MGNPGDKYGSRRRQTVTAVVLSHNRKQSLAVTLDRLSEHDLLEVIVVDGGSSDGSQELVRTRGGNVRLIEAGGNVGTAGRNLGARAARGDLLLTLDDDSYPLPGAVELLAEMFTENPRLAAAGGLIRDRDRRGQPLPAEGTGSWDWTLRAGQSGTPPREGLRASSFATCGAMLRRDAFMEIGGFFEPYFLMYEEVDLATRLLASGWDVRYLPTAEFVHAKPPRTAEQVRRMLRWRVRNGIWYACLRLPSSSAAWRIPVKLCFELLECAGRGQPGAWFAGVRDAWRQRDRVRGARDPVDRDLVPRVQVIGIGMQLQYLTMLIRHRLGPVLSSRRPRPSQQS